MTRDRASYTPPPIETPNIEWGELTPKEQLGFIRLGYKPPPLTIMSNAAYTELGETSSADQDHS